MKTINECFLGGKGVISGNWDSLLGTKTAILLHYRVDRVICSEKNTWGYKKKH